MADREAPNPERRTDAAVLCVCIGLALMALSWVLGLGGALATLASANATAMAGGIASLLLLPIVACCGAILFVVGLIWIFVHVVLDRREDEAKERYSRDVQR